MKNSPSSNPLAETHVGSLQVVATPIGNLEDLSPRALAVLRTVDLVAAEDTRRTGRLLSHFGVKTPLIAVHDHNEEAVAAGLVARLTQGESMALVSDAGTPLVSDPGYRLVNAAIEAGIDVVSIPGPCAVTAALSIAGLPTNRFVFEGFLPTAPERRAAVLEALRFETRTCVLFASVHQIASLLPELAEQLGDARPAALCRELTKRHECVYRGTLGTLCQTEITAKGEFVVVIGGAAKRAEPDAEVDRLLDLLLSEMSTRSAAKIASELTGRARNELYQRAIGRQKDS